MFLSSALAIARKRANVLSFLLASLCIAPSLSATRYYPVRNQNEAAVIEWGNSAIISALDAVVAEFGPQTSQAALMEVETAPVLSKPLEGPIKNKDLVVGNVVIMTDMGKASAVELAVDAQASGAAALIVVHVDDSRPDEAPRLLVEKGEEELAQTVDIPVVAISMTSASVLAMALIPEEDRRNIRSLEEANGLPERIRLYAGEDRPFFEDIESAGPTLYLIHNLLTAEECEALLKKAEKQLKPITTADDLSYTDDPSIYVKTSRATLWQGEWKTTSQKAVEERIGQVTGFPQSHFSDFVVDKLQMGSYWKSHTDTLLKTFVPLAAVNVFLTDSAEAEWVYAKTASGDTIRIRPRKGMAVVHHNTDENYRADPHVKHSLESVSGPLYVARKFIFHTPVSLGRRFVLPLFNGRTAWLSQIHDVMVEHLGKEQGPAAFDMLLLAGPAGLVALIAQCVMWALNKKPTSTPVKRKSKKKNGRKKKD